MNLLPGSYILVNKDALLEEISAMLILPRDKLHRHPDVHVIKGEGSIGIDIIREAGRYLRIKPIMASYKFLFIENFHLATEEAQNAFLKTFEEPPEYAYIFLITPYIDRLLKTVVSRAQIIEKSKLKNQKSKPQIKSKKFSELAALTIGDRLLWLDGILQGLENKNELRRTLLGLIDDLLLEAVELGKEGKFSLEATNSLKEAKWRIEQGFSNPKLLVEECLLML